jgi:hypothetical protein
VNRTAKLGISLIIDALGYASYLMPFWGELSDIVFAFVNAGWIWYAYRSKPLAFLGFAEEILPFTDFIPSATIAHFMTKE